VRQFSPTSNRPDPTDRNPVFIKLGSFGPFTAGGSAILFTYTVPANRRALLTATTQGVVTTALVAGQNGAVQIGVTGQANGNPEVWLPATSALNTRDSAVVPGIRLGPGDTIQGLVSIGAGAGVIQAFAACFGVEYDA